jgi:hypothetical protein
MALFNDERITLTKLDAACRQLDTALELWFAEREPVSIHQLAYAAYEVIHFVAKSKDPNIELLFDSLIIKDEYRREWRNLIAKEANFFKHADRDPDGVIDFAPDQAKFFIMFAIHALISMKHQLTTVEKAFQVWLGFNHPDGLREEGRKIYTEPFSVEQLKHIRSLSKSEFLEAFMSASQSRRPRGVTIGHFQMPEF